MISFEGVTKRYGAHIALDSATFSIEAGELAFIVGSSGSGKTTALKLLTREIGADSGRIIIEGINITTLPKRKIPQLRTSVSHIPQDFRLLEGKTVQENLEYSLAVAGWRRRKAKARIESALDVVGLANKEERHPDELSGGERQRVAIARAVASGAPIIVADEPTGNLDPNTSVQIVMLLKSIADEGTTILMSTHDPKIVDSMGQRVIGLVGGHVERNDASGTYRHTIS
jgi:cell division transport system ATP-binding protein